MTDDIRKAAIEAAAAQLHGYIAPQLAQEVARDAIDAYERAMWRPVEEAPHDETVLLGCEQQWPSRVWISEVGTASAGWKRGGVSTMHRHGMAQFFRPLPLPPEDAA